MSEPTHTVVVDLLYGGTATHPDWCGFCTSEGELHILLGNARKVATFAAGQWSRAYLSDVAPEVTTPPNPYAPHPPRDGDAF
jgi:hypothetical protein